MLELLLERYGYILDDEIQEMIDLFGEDFKVIVKDFNGERYAVRLADLDSFEKANNVIVREVFINSGDYRNLKNIMEESSDQKYITSFVANNQAL